MLNNLGVGLSEAGRYAEALDYLRSAHEIFVSLGARLFEGLALDRLGDPRAAQLRAELAATTA